MKVTAGATCSSAPMTAAEYASRSAPSSVRESSTGAASAGVSPALSKDAGRGVNTASAQNDLGGRGEPIDDEAIHPPHENHRIIEFSALREHGLVVEHVREVGKGGLIGRAFQ